MRASGAEARWGHALLVALALVVAAARPARAEEPKKISVGTYLEYEHFSYRAPGKGQQVDSRDALTAIPKVDWNPAESLFLKFALALRKDFSEEERSRIYPYEGFLSVEREGWAAKIGRQFITWGRADSLRPTDVFARHDFTDLIENREEAVDAVKLDLFRGPWTLEGVWVPVLQPDIVSFKPDNRWNGLPTEGDVPGVGRLALTFREDPEQRPPKTFESGQGGVRLSGSAHGWDFAGMYYYGYDRVPTIIRQELSFVDPVAQRATITLVPIHKRIHVFGGDVATAFSGWGLRSEAAYTLTSDPGSVDPEVDDPYFRLTAGVDRTFTRIPVGQSLLVILQYALDTELPQRGAPNQREGSDPLLHPFRNAMALNTTWKYTEFVRLHFKGYVDLEERDYLLQPEFVWQPVDAMSIVLGGDVLGGRSSTFFGRFRDNDRVRIRISYAF